MNKPTVIYIVMIIAIAFLTILMNVHWTVFSLITFSHKLHITIEAINSLLMLLIFLACNYLYSKAKDERLIIMAGGFLAGAILNCVHIVTVTTFPYDLIDITNLQKNPTLVYLLLGNLMLTFSIYFAITHKPSSLQQNDFVFKTYSLYFFILSALTICPLLIHHFWVGLTYQLDIIMQSLEFIRYSLYIMLAFMIINIRQASNLTFPPIFLTGLLILGLGGLLYVNPLSIQINEILAHIFQAIGLMFILFGIPHFQTYAKFMKFKDELAAYFCLVLISFYIIFASIISGFFQIIFPPFSAYVFVEFLLIFQFAVYLLANKVTQPITNLTQALSNYIPGEKALNIPVERQDEIGILTEKINALSILSYQKILEVSEIAERELAIIRIFETMRRIPDQNIVKNTIIEEIKNAFNPDRCFIVLYDSINNSFYYDRYAENLPSKTLKNFDVDDDALKFERFNKVFEGNIEICFANIEEYIEKNALYGTDKENLLREYNIKSRCHIPITYSDQLLGYIIIEYQNDNRELSKEDLTFLNTMATQIGITIKQ